MFKKVLISILWAIVISFLLTFGWFLLFGYDTKSPVFDNILSIIGNYYFYSAFGVWSGLFAIFFTLPAAFLFGKKTKPSGAI